MPAAVERLAPAKVNLALRVTGRRPPGGPWGGYHELDSLVAFAAIGDRVSLAPAAALSLTLAGPFAAALEGGGENLVVTAARRLAEAAGRAPAVAIRLEKNLPVAAGLGGGSADAAAVLDALAELWALAPGAPDLAALAAGIGADLPVCLAGQPCRVRGIGEQVEPLATLPPAALLLVNPGVAQPTPPVFAARRGPFGQPLPWPAAGIADLTSLARLVREGGNDLEAAARALCPAIGAVLAALRGLAPLASGLSGSGATCFALYPCVAEAAAAADALAAAHPGWWIAAAPLLPARAPLP